MLYGWWEPPDGSGARGAFIHDPAVPLLIAGRAPEMAAALAGTLSKLGRHVSGVDAPVEAADAFAAAWSQRERSSVRVHRHCRVYRLTAAAAAAAPGAGRGGPARRAGPGGGPGAWPPPQTPGRPPPGDGAPTAGCSSTGSSRSGSRPGSGSARPRTRPTT